MSDLSLRFNGSVLEVKSKRGNRWFDAVSGKPVGGEFTYTVARQKLKNEGPIPAGDYYIIPSELRDNNTFLRWLAGRQWNPVAWGRYRITIHSSPGTETYGRSGFFIHGGDVPGSIGCIDLHKHMNGFIDYILEEPGFSGENKVTLVVDYPAK